MPGSDVDRMLEGSDLAERDLLRIMVELDDLLLPYAKDLLIYHEISHAELIGSSLFSVELSDEGPVDFLILILLLILLVSLCSVWSRLLPQTIRCYAFAETDQQGDDLG